MAGREKDREQKKMKKRTVLFANDEEDVLKVLDMGTDDHITKPFDKDKFLVSVKMLLRKSS